MMNLTPDQMWAAIQDLDSAAELRFEPPVWYVRLPGVVYEALNTMCAVASPQGAFQRSGDRMDVGPSRIAPGNIEPAQEFGPGGDAHRGTIRGSAMERLRMG